MLGDRLYLARKKAGLSLRGLEERIGKKVSHQAIRKYERGEMSPGSDVLLSIASAVDMPLSFFLSPTEVKLSELNFRKKAAARKRDVKAVEAAVLDHVERYLQVEEVLGLPSSQWEFPEGFPYWVESFEDAEKAAESLRRSWDLGLDPIPDLTELLEERGIKVILLDFPLSVDAMTCSILREGTEPVQVMAVCDKNGVSIERRRFSLAHELGHLVLNVADAKREEKICNRFAGALLAPAQSLVRKFGRKRNSLGYAEVVEVKRLFGISAAALIMRLKDLGIISQGLLVRIFSGIGKGWRKSEPEPLTRADCRETPRRFPRLCLRAISEELVSLSKGSELLRRSVDEISDMVWGKGVLCEGSCQ